MPDTWYKEHVFPLPETAPRERSHPTRLFSPLAFLETKIPAAKRQRHKNVGDSPTPAGGRRIWRSTRGWDGAEPLTAAASVFPKGGSKKWLLGKAAANCAQPWDDVTARGPHVGVRSRCTVPHTQPHTRPHACCQLPATLSPRFICCFYDVGRSGRARGP